jgi:hypothetical protein
MRLGRDPGEILDEKLLGFANNLGSEARKRRSVERQVEGIQYARHLLHREKKGLTNNAH